MANVGKSEVALSTLSDTIFTLSNSNGGGSKQKLFEGIGQPESKLAKPFPAF